MADLQTKTANLTTSDTGLNNCVEVSKRLSWKPKLKPAKHIAEYRHKFLNGDRQIVMACY